MIYRAKWLMLFDCFLGRFKLYRKHTNAIWIKGNKHWFSPWVAFQGLKDIGYWEEAKDRLVSKGEWSVEDYRK